MREKNVIQDNKMRSLTKLLTELKNECVSNKSTIVTVTTRRDNTR